MGYIETILGYGANHMETPYKLLFKKIVRLDTKKKITMYEPKIYKLMEQDVELEFTLHDDIYVKDSPNETKFTVKDCDEYFEFLSYNHFVSKKWVNCYFARKCCFVGIILGVTDYDTGNADIEENLKGVQEWISELKSEGRFPQDAKLVMCANCCS